MFCEACGKQIPDDSKFCEFCGTPVTEKARITPVKLVEKKQGNLVKKPSQKQTSDVLSEPKSKSRNKVLPVILLFMISLGGYFAINMFGMDEILNKLVNLPNIILGRKESDTEPTRDDFAWYETSSYDVVPFGGTELMYEDILGKWKVMVVNYVSQPEETIFSSVTLNENTSSFDNTAVDFTHHYVEFDGQKSAFKGDDAKDLIYANYADGYLTLMLGDDRIADIIFWEKDGQEYGQSHIFSDWDKDGIADLVNVVLFTR